MPSYLSQVVLLLVIFMTTCLCFKPEVSNSGVKLNDESSPLQRTDILARFKGSCLNCGFEEKSNGSTGIKSLMSRIRSKFSKHYGSNKEKYPEEESKSTERKAVEESERVNYLNYGLNQNNIDKI